MEAKSQSLIPNPFSFNGIYEPQSNTKDCCTHCGKPIENLAQAAWVHIIDGGKNLAPVIWLDDDERIDSAGNMMWFQVGPVCKLKVPKSHRSSATIDAEGYLNR